MLALPFLAPHVHCSYDDGLNCVGSALHKNVGGKFGKGKIAKGILISCAVSRGLSGKQQNPNLTLLNMNGVYWHDRGLGNQA